MIDNIISQIAALEEKIFSDGWGFDSIKHTLECDYNSIYVIWKDEDSLYIEDVRFASDFSCKDIGGYLISSHIADETELLRVAVGEEYRGCGYGKKLVLDYLSRMGTSCESGFLEVRDSNQVARRLYESCGYKKIAIRKNYYKAPNEDGVVYQITF